MTRPYLPGPRPRATMPPVALPAGAWTLLALALAGCGQGSPPAPSGTFEATVVEVAPVATGRALRVGPREGQAVAAGDTLIVLDLEVVALQRHETAAREAGLRAERRAAQAERDQARRQLELAGTTLQRVEVLLAQGTATRQRVDDLASQRDVAAARVRAADARTAALDGELEHLQAALAVQDRQLRDAVIVSPIGGTVLTRSLEPGEVAIAGRTALRLADLGRLELRIFLEAEDLARVRLGQDLPVAVDALPGQAFTGRVAWISDEAEFTPKNAQTRRARAQLVYAVKLQVTNPQGNLHVGMPAEVRLP